MFMPGNRISLRFFEGVEPLYSRNGKNNADQWLWAMELSLRSCLLFDIVSGAVLNVQTVWVGTHMSTRF